MGLGESVTIIVHGTFADDETWWKPGRDLPPTAADDLEKALRGHGMSGSVWRGLRDDPPARIDVDDPEAVVTAIDEAFGWSERTGIGIGSRLPTTCASRWKSSPIGSIPPAIESRGSHSVCTSLPTPMAATSFSR